MSEYRREPRIGPERISDGLVTLDQMTKPRLLDRL
jgi:hypothetical protein